jgi:hypothetical protein
MEDKELLKRAMEFIKWVANEAKLKRLIKLKAKEFIADMEKKNAT